MKKFKVNLQVQIQIEASEINYFNHHPGRQIAFKRTQFFHVPRTEKLASGQLQDIDSL